MSTEEKEKTLQRFRTGMCRVLVSTDLVSRGLDLPDVTAVIQVDFPVNLLTFCTELAAQQGQGNLE